MKRTVKSFPAEKSQNKTATIRPGSEYNGSKRAHHAAVSRRHLALLAS